MTEDLIQAGFDARNLRDWMFGNAANLEYICNQVWIGSIKKLKGAFGRIALIGTYRIWLALILEQQRFEWRRADKSSNLIDFPSSCVFVNSNNAFIFHYAGSLGALNPSGKNPLSGPMRGWLCLEVIIPWKCYQPYAMNSSISPLNEEPTSL